MKLITLTVECFYCFRQAFLLSAIGCSIRRFWRKTESLCGRGSVFFRLPEREEDRKEEKDMWPHRWVAGDFRTNFDNMRTIY